MSSDGLLAFVTPRKEPPGLEVTVNFGMFAGRAATPAEIDHLAASLLPYAGEVTIVAEDRHEISREVEASVAQVRIEIAAEYLPGGDLSDALERRIIDTAERWAETCIAERRSEASEL
jgi:ribosomal protein L12E/L44/L45/RPP1/RPP2